MQGVSKAADILAQAPNVTEFYMETSLEASPEFYEYYFDVATQGYVFVRNTTSPYDILYVTETSNDLCNVTISPCDSDGDPCST